MKIIMANRHKNKKHFIKLLLKLALAVILFLNFRLSYGISQPNSVNKESVEEEIFSGVDVKESSIAIGDGRNDGVKRIYAGSKDYRYPGYIWEITWNGSNWEINQIDPSPEVGEYILGGEPCSIKIGDGRNDGINRVYVGYSSIDKVNEYTWTGSSWSKTTIGLAGLGSHLFIGDGHNDGINRIYAASSTDKKVYEFTWTGSSWTKVEIADFKFEEGVNFYNYEIIDARNDGVKRLYINGCEFTWNGSGWDKITILYFASMVIGDGRNDGIKRIYVREPYTEKVYEYTWNGSTWTCEYTGLKGAVLYLKDLRNDGINRLYLFSYQKISQPAISLRKTVTPDTQPVLIEATWEDDKWIVTGIYKYRGGEYAEVGEVRKRGEKRLYTTGSGILEYLLLSPQQPYEKTKTVETKLQLVNNYFKRGSGWTTVWYYVDTAGDVSLDVYTIDGRLVKRLFSGYRERGEYNEVWTGRDENGDVVSTGIYLIRLKAPGTDVIKKVCVVR
jgi:hypothetical protein